MLLKNCLFKFNQCFSFLEKLEIKTILVPLKTQTGMGVTRLIYKDYSPSKSVNDILFI